VAASCNQTSKHGARVRSDAPHLVMVCTVGAKPLGCNMHNLAKTAGQIVNGATRRIRHPRDRAAGTAKSLRPTIELRRMYYNLSQSSRAATIQYRRKRIAEAMWGRLATGWQPAADWQSACRDLPVISQADGCGFAARRYAGQVANLRPIGNRPACSTRNSRKTPEQFAACIALDDVSSGRTRRILVEYAPVFPSQSIATDRIKHQAPSRAMDSARRIPWSAAAPQPSEVRRPPGDPRGIPADAWGTIAQSSFAARDTGPA